eukprot:223204-Pyramimonas_sp.AAC.1
MVDSLPFDAPSGDGWVWSGKGGMLSQDGVVKIISDIERIEPKCVDGGQDVDLGHSQPVHNLGSLRGALQRLQDCRGPDF